MLILITKLNFKWDCELQVVVCSFSVQSFIAVTYIIRNSGGSRSQTNISPWICSQKISPAWQGDYGDCAFSFQQRF